MIKGIFLELLRRGFTHTTAFNLVASYYAHEVMGGVDVKTARRLIVEQNLLK